MARNAAPRNMLPLHYVASLLQRHFLQICLLVALGCAVTVFGFGIWICLSAPSNIRGVELNVILTIQKMLNGKPLYTDPSEIPFDIAQYSPLYYLLCAGLADFLGVSFDDPARIMRLCRLVSLVITSLTVAGCFFFTKRVLGVRTPLAVISSAFALIATSPWYFLARPDALMSLTMLASFAFAVASGSRHSAISYFYLFLSVCLGWASALAKQSGMQTIIIVPLYFLFIGQFQKFAAVLAATAVVGGIAYGILTHTYAQLIPNVVGGVTTNGVRLDNAFAKTYTVFFSNFSFVLGLTLLGMIHWARRPRIDDRHAFFLVSLPVLLVFATVTGLKGGSAENYYNEFLIVAAIAAACFVQDIDPIGSSPPFMGDQRFVVTLVASYLLCFLPYWTLVPQFARYYGWRINPTVSLLIPKDSLWSDDYRAVGRQLRSDLASDPAGLVLSFNLALNSFIPERCVVPQKDLADTSYDLGIVDYSLFQYCVAQGRIKYVLTDGDARIPDSFLGANISDRFVLERRIGKIAIYRWRNQ
jgi:hypothetical protein